MEAFAAARVPVGPVFTIQQALDDPHISTEFYEPTTIDGVTSSVPAPRYPLRMPGAEPLGVRAPSLGEHTNDILHWLGYSDTDLAALRSTGTI